MRLPNDNIVEGSAPFNMALATLERLSKILIRITEVAMVTEIPPEERQNKILELLKQLYINSAPLLKEEIVKKYEYVLQLEMKKINLLGKHKSGSTFVTNKKYNYCMELDIQINKALIGIQQELQKEKYFMPPKYDVTSGWDQLN